MTKLTIKDIRNWRDVLEWCWQNKKSLMLCTGIAITFLRWWFGAITTEELLKLLTMLNPFSAL